MRGSLHWLLEGNGRHDCVSGQILLLHYAWRVCRLSNYWHWCTVSLDIRSLEKCISNHFLVLFQSWCVLEWGFFWLTKNGSSLLQSQDHALRHSDLLMTFSHLMLSGRVWILVVAIYVLSSLLSIYVQSCFVSVIHYCISSFCSLRFCCLNKIAIALHCVLVSM